MLTRREHMALHPGWDGWHAKKERCIRGHEFTPENTYVRKSGARMCRACMNLRVREWRAKKSAPGGLTDVMGPVKEGGNVISKLSDRPAGDVMSGTGIEVEME